MTIDVIRRPRPPLRLPLLGHALSFARDPLEFIEAMRPAGDVVMIRLGPLDVCLVNSPALVRIDMGVEPREVNGQPGAILRDREGNVVGTLTLDVLGGRIQAIRSVVNPDKLGHLGPVADAWAFAREVKQTRRPND